MWVRSGLAPGQAPCKACWSSLLEHSEWMHAQRLFWAMPCPSQPHPQGELSSILDHIPLIISLHLQNSKSRSEEGAGDRDAHPQLACVCPPATPAFLTDDCRSEKYRVPRTRTSGLNFSSCKLQFCWFRGRGVRRGSVLIGNIIIRTRRPWLTVHFLISHHILFKLSADLLHLKPHSAAKKKKSYCCIYWGETSQLLLLLLQQGEKTEMLRIFPLVI